MKILFILLDYIQQGYPTVRVLLPDETKKFYQEDWFNALIGVVVGFLLAELANWKRQRKAKKEQLKEKLLFYYSESSSLLNVLRSTAYEAMRTNVLSEFSGRTLSGPPDIHQIKENVIPTKTIWETNLIMYLKNVKHFQGLIDEDDSFKELVKKLDSFSIDLKSRISSENASSLATAEGTASIEADGLLNNVLQPISNYMDDFILKLS